MTNNLTANEKASDEVEGLLARPGLADALESEQFRRFLDQIPIAIVVSELKGGERIVYANPEFERISGQTAKDVEGQPWSVLHGRAEEEGVERDLGEAVSKSSDFVGTFRIEHAEGEIVVDAHSNVIEDDDGTPAFRLVALVDVSAHEKARRAELHERVREKDALLREIQHRVRNKFADDHGTHPP